MVESFEPIINAECRVLILGSMPSVQSLRKREYYGNPQNHFWRIIYGLFGEMPDQDYECRKAFILKHRIALWDVLKCCERPGSSDADITNPTANNIPGLLGRYPAVHSVFFNGAKSEELFNRFFKGWLKNRRELHFQRLPSTSPARTMKLEEKLEEWQIILSRLNGS